MHKPSAVQMGARMGPCPNLPEI